MPKLFEAIGNSASNAVWEAGAPQAAKLLRESDSWVWCDDDSDGEGGGGGAPGVTASVVTAALAAGAAPERGQGRPAGSAPVRSSSGGGGKRRPKVRGRRHVWHGSCMPWLRIHVLLLLLFQRVYQPRLHTPPLHQHRQPAATLHCLIHACIILC